MDPSVDTIKCTYKLGDSLEKSPHIHEPFRATPKKFMMMCLMLLEILQ